MLATAYQTAGKSTNRLGIAQVKGYTDGRVPEVAGPAGSEHLRASRHQASNRGASDTRACPSNQKASPLQISRRHVSSMSGTKLRAQEERKKGDTAYW